MSFILHHPTLFMSALVRTLGIHTIILWYLETVGVLGWVTLPMQPVAVYLLPLANFMIVWKQTRGNVERSTRSALWHLALAFATAILIITAMYLMNAHVGANEVTGVQGRYFIPILVLAGMAVIELAPDRRPSAPGWRNLASISAFIALQIAAMDATILRAFHVF
jgi:uncharacterized membrane protein